MKLTLSCPFLCKASALVLTSAIAVGLSGCALGNMELSGPEPTTNVSFQGTVHGGEQPVAGSVIQLWEVGTSGYGSAATGLIPSANQAIAGNALTDSNGKFNITGTFTCSPTTALVYITASGGNPGLAPGTNNSAIFLAAALGPCNTLNSSTVITINEVTTAATAYALGQYFASTSEAPSTDTFGSPNTTQAKVGITNAFGTVNNLVSTSTGTAISSATITSGLGNITTTVENTKLNSVADILAACVDTTSSSSSNCQTLFSSVVPTGGTQPTDTLEAAVDMSLNPTSTNINSSATNITALYALQTGTAAPFSGLGTQPTDWTIGINYSAGTSTSNTLINSATDLAIDSSGDIWISNLSGTSTYEALTELSPTGTPLANPFNSGATSPASMAASSPRNLAVDTNNNVFVGTSSGSGYIFEYSNGGVSSSFAAGGQPYCIVIDGSNNIWVCQNSGTASASLLEFTSGVLAASNEVKYPFLTGTANTLTAEYGAISTTGNVWLSSGATSNLLYQASGMNPGTCTTFPCTTGNDTSLATTYTQITGGTAATPLGVTAAPGGNMWVANNLSGNNTVLLCTSPAACTPYGSSASINAPRKLAIDGAGNVWIINHGVTSISELSSTGTILSQSTGEVGYTHTGIASGVAIEIDPSGNVWVANNTAPGATAGASVFELVGAASPTVTPLALALKNSTLGAKP